MDNELPEWLQRKPNKGSKLSGLDENDFPGAKVKKSNVQSAKDQIEAVAPVVYMPAVRKPQFADPRWLLKNCDPRPVQLEGLRRGHMGYALFDSPQDIEQGIERFRVLRQGYEARKGFAYFMEQRLGKTPLALAEFALLRADYDYKWCLTFAPMSYKPMWPIEAEEKGAPFPGFNYESGKIKQLQAWIDANQKWGGLIAVNFEACRTEDLMAILHVLAQERVYLNIDESIQVKDPFSDRSKILLDLAKVCDARRVLTGKPITQGAHDLYQQMRMVGQFNGRTFVDFKNRYCKLGGFQGKAVVGVEEPQELRDQIEPHVFIARRAVWLPTPGKDYVTRELSLRGRQAELYKQMEEELVIEVEGQTISADQIITKLIKLQQIRSGHIKDEDGNTLDLMPAAQNPVLQDLKHYVENEITTKCIIIAHFRRTLDLLKQVFPGCSVIRSKDWHKSNGVSVEFEKERFNTDPGTRVLVAAARVVKYGHTLMGSSDDPCLNLIFFENDYSLDTRSQDEDRPVGEGQRGVLVITDYACSKTDYATIAALVRKEDMASALMGYNRSEGVLPYIDPDEDEG